MGHWEGREGQEVRRGIRQQLGHLGKGLPELFHHSVQLAVDLGRRQLLARWTARIGLGEQLVTTKTLRRRFFSLAGRLTRSARRLTLHLPQRWPWENQFSRALARLRALPLPA